MMKIGTLQALDADVVFVSQDFDFLPFNSHDTKQDTIHRSEYGFILTLINEFGADTAGFIRLQGDRLQLWRQLSRRLARIETTLTRVDTLQ